MKYKDLKKLVKEDREKKLKELKMELVKAQASKEHNSKPRQIRKVIARINTINASEKGGVDKE